MVNFDKLNELYNFLESIKNSVLINSPVFKLYNVKRKNKWLIVWSTLLSSRTTDKALLKVLPLLSGRFSSPFDVLKSDLKELEELFRPLGFYRNKAKIFFEFNRSIVEKYNGQVPSTLEELIQLPGVGLKVGSIILNEVYSYDFIGVDVHVFRILNRVGVLKTSTPDDTWKVIHKEEFRRFFTKDMYSNLNRYLVAFGQTICKVKPNCFICGFNKKCDYYLYIAKK
ncbi:MAG: endonuclease III [Candidatus Calescibacterium sp.]|nr:endonuclease III [Candidatus Calescibacterium sp.]MDW8133202.1 endonuclease III [Candidatus Calescibacterium sp.]